MLDFDVQIGLCVPAYNEKEARDKISDILECIEDIFNTVEEPYSLKIEEVGKWIE